MHEVNEIAAVVRSNEGIQSLSLPNCVLDQKDLKIIIQAMLTVLSLQHVNFNANEVDSDIANLFANNNELKQVNFEKNLLTQSGFQSMKAYLLKLKGLKHIRISELNVMTKDVINKIAAMIKNNEHIQSLSLPNCILDQKDLKIIIQSMQTVSSLQYVDFNNSILDDELASDVALLIAKNRELIDLKFSNLH